jgi:acyl-CoA synthetase (NDP forming)
VLQAIGAATHDGVPVAAVVMAPATADATPPVPVYATPEHAARALGHAARHGRRVRAPLPVPQVPADVDADAASAVIAEALAAGPCWLDTDAAARLLRAYGLALAPFEVASSPSAGGRSASATDGVEMLVGVVSDERFGPVVACAAGGTTAALLGDVQVRLAPLADAEAAAMVRALRTFPLLDGYRGAVRADVRALEQVVVRVAALAAAHPEVAELDLDPVVVSPSGALVVAARVRVARPPGRPPLAAL